MTDQKKRKFVNYSPVGTLKFPRLNKPDEFRGKTFFKATLLLDPSKDDVKEFVEKMETHVFSSLSEDEYRPLKLNDDGVWELVVKRNADFGPPRFFVPTGEKSSEEIDKAPGLIWGGTEASVSFTTYPYKGGVSFALTGVTIHTLVEPEERVEPSKSSDVSDIFNS